MNNTKTTKRALLSSVIAMLVCITMLIGTTFAWFTDSASTAVNKIQAGTLKIELQYATAWDASGVPTAWADAEGKTLNFRKAAGAAANEAILWEPGCTYKLPELRIVNNGNLALQYKILITGIAGDAKLNEVIDWEWAGCSIDENGVYEPRRGGDLSSGDSIFGSLKPNTITDDILISGSMKKEAGNDYQGKSIDGIGITVVATQDTVEYDSNGNTYDATAEYPVVVSANVDVTADNKVATETTVVSSQKAADDTTPLAKVTIPAGAAVIEGTNQLKLTIDEVAAPANFVATVGTDNRTFEVDMKGLNKEANTELFKVEIYVGTGLSNLILKHNGTDMNKKSSISSVAADQDYYYSSSTGMVTFLTKTFSPFTFVYDKESWSKHAAESYETSVNTTDKIVTIASAEELALFAKEVNSGNSYAGYTVNLTEDVDLIKYQWSPIGKSGKPFQGTFNGQDHIISNLFINKPFTSDVGLFGFTTNGEVKNFTLHNAFVKGYLDVGAIAGTPYTSKYTNISLTGDVKVDGYAYVGGMFGKNAYADLTDLTIKVDEGSYVNADSEYYRTYVGGLVGFMGEDPHTVKNVTSNIDVIGSTCDVGGITGIAHYNNTFINCHSSGNVTLKSANDAGDELEIGGIAGVWHNKNGTTVTISDCSYTGTLSSYNVNTGFVTDFANNGLVGRQYSASGTGTLIIN